MNRLNLKPNESLFTTYKGDVLIFNKKTSEWRELTKEEKNMLARIQAEHSAHSENKRVFAPFAKEHLLKEGFSADQFANDVQRLAELEVSAGKYPSINKAYDEIMKDQQNSYLQYTKTKTAGITR